MEDMKVQISEEVLRKAAQMLMNQKIHYRMMASKSTNKEREARWNLKSIKVAEVHEAICKALVEAEEAET